MAHDQIFEVLEVDAGLVSVLQPQDRLHIVRTNTADLALSLIRGDELIVALDLESYRRRRRWSVPPEGIEPSHQV